MKGELRPKSQECNQARRVEGKGDIQRKGSGGSGGKGEGELVACGGGCLWCGVGLFDGDHTFTPSFTLHGRPLFRAPAARLSCGADREETHSRR
jgi:hypothetical protein